MLAVSRRSALVLATKRSPACLSVVGRGMSTTEEQKDQDNILPVSEKQMEAVARE
jgi:hypothetical protein